MSIRDKIIKTPCTGYKKYIKITTLAFGSCPSSGEKHYEEIARQLLLYTDLFIFSGRCKENRVTNRNEIKYTKKWNESKLNIMTDCTEISVESRDVGFKT